MITEADTCRK